MLSFPVRRRRRNERRGYKLLTDLHVVLSDGDPNAIVQHGERQHHRARNHAFRCDMGVVISGTGLARGRQ